MRSDVTKFAGVSSGGVGIFPRAFLNGRIVEHEGAVIIEDELTWQTHPSQRSFDLKSNATRHGDWQIARECLPPYEVLKKVPGQRCSSMARANIHSDHVVAS